MKKTQLFFCEEVNEERCFDIDYILEDIKEQGLKKVSVFKAVRAIKSEHFWCKAIGECCIKPPEGEPCGKECEDYEPRNGKSGCCKHRGYCYEFGDEYILYSNGKLEKK